MTRRTASFLPFGSWMVLLLGLTVLTGDANANPLKLIMPAVLVGKKPPATKQSWHAPQLIETHNEGEAIFPQIVFDSSGNAIAIWPQSDGTRYNLWANRYNPVTGWGTPQLIENDNTSDVFGGSIAFDSAGNAIAVWPQSDGTRYNLWANRYNPVTGWGTPQLIENDNAGDAFNGPIAFDSAGNAIAVWQQSDGTRVNIWASRYNPVNSWGTPQLIENDNAGDASNVKIAFDSAAAGNAIAIWQQFDGTRNNIWANRYNPVTGWGTPQLIENNTGEAWNHQLTVDKAGNAIAVWQQSNDSRDNIWANRYNPVTGWGTPQLIENDNAGMATRPQIAFDNAGNAIAVWEQDDNSFNGMNIYANRYDTVTGWGTSQAIRQNNTGSGEWPMVACDSVGNAIAVWQQYDNSSINIWANRYVAGSGWKTAQLIETDDTGSAQFPTVAINGAGNAIAVWQQSDGTRNNIWAAEYK